MDVIFDTLLNSIPQGVCNLPYERNYYHQFLTCCGYSASNPPLADLLRRLHNLDGTWLIASPIHWQATHNDAMITACDNDLQLSFEDGKLWFDAFSDFLKLLGMQGYYHNAYTWLIKVDGLNISNAIPVDKLLHKSIFPYLKALDDTLFWQRFITESQLYFSGHTLNKLRSEACQINGLWIWGGGVLNAPSQRLIIVDNSLSLQIAKLLSENITDDFFNKPFAKDAIFLWQDTTPYLQEKLSRHNVNWYWRNCAYQTKPMNLAKYIWRKFYYGDNTA